jgi:hypothetical protein
MMTRRVLQFGLTVLAASSVAHPASSQAADSAGSRTEVTWAINVANKGISIPTSTLEKPTATVDMSIRRGGFSVDPQFRVGLDGTPWSFVFRGRYRLVDNERLGVIVGAHSVFAFRTATVTVNGVAREVVMAQHFAAGELSPSYALSKNVSVGTCYVYARGLDADVTKHTHFVAARAGLGNLRLPARFVVRLDPEAYYLRSDDRDAMYLDSRVTLSKRDLPVAISGIFNRRIRPTEPRGRAFLWNVGLTYGPSVMR